MRRYNKPTFWILILTFQYQLLRELESIENIPKTLPIYFAFNTRVQVDQATQLEFTNSLMNYSTVAKLDLNQEQVELKYFNSTYEYDIFKLEPNRTFNVGLVDEKIAIQTRP